MSRGTAYAIYGLISLAELARDEPVQLREIAACRGIPANYLAKIFQTLARAHIVRSFRGARRGFLLALPPERVTVRGILEAIEGPLNPQECFLDLCGDCSAIGHCGLYAGLRDCLEVFGERLSRITLAHLVEAAGQAGHPGRRRHPAPARPRREARRTRHAHPRQAHSTP